eukprot:TRINITY_DN269_c0_g1_i3.p1 TRINITY_DN269_c0_g1~~TRINITY_DN269_c0_g1_i3.p1  ORF type:complete len:247 (+),score=59.44 TRINITY_DN269_c0_g1_i3:166-906(+)
MTTEMKNLKEPLIQAAIADIAAPTIQKKKKKKKDEVPLCGILSLKYYRQFFKITSADVATRIKYAFVPFSNKFAEHTEDSADLWGPFWIQTTLIFVLAVCANITRFLKIKTEKLDDFKYELNFVPAAAGAVYFFGFIYPLLLTLLMKCFGSKGGFIQTICVMGYGMVVFIPVCFLCLIQHDKLQWALVGYGGINSALFLFNNLANDMRRMNQSQRFVILAFAFAVQVALIITFKLKFFDIFFAYKS